MYGTRPNGTKHEIHGPGGQSTLKTDRGGCTSEVSVGYVLDIIAEVSFCIFLPGMGQIGKGGMRVGLGVGVLEHQRWTGFSRRSLLRYLHNYRSEIFQNQED
ncbi:uncharacterized protein BDCG_04294 [Blastomyces dermatitidis ER-3]|uniref:Uncharacterized protein n=1 Tax=Ajellomyces dermatitidis (strain ER-3 / ATCC MYA-2586) TaxID=559297 RepID=A0ABP2EY82_AJEDR|nr:uncharacterized protein BDCG_04294 [Blastomyces dermatitidis ER-3]EEQ89174.1 hypothetical protein BDCG_04294 [Blastomyces dermatitidis ER-3]